MGELVLLAKQSSVFPLGLIIGFMSAMGAFVAIHFGVRVLTQPKRKLTSEFGLFDEHADSDLKIPQRTFLFLLEAYDAKEAARLRMDSNFRELSETQMEFYRMQLDFAIKMAGSRTSSFTQVAFSGMFMWFLPMLTMRDLLSSSQFLLVWVACSVIFGLLGAILAWITRPKSIWDLQI